MNTPRYLVEKSNTRRAAGLVLVLVLIMALGVPPVWAAPPAQAAQIMRIGYLGLATSETAQGALLAIDQINSVGGFTADDGATYQFELISLASSPNVNTLAASVEAMKAQGVIAILGPDDSDLLTPDNLQVLLNAGVPVLTGATTDT
jgi:ABC-type branched-subunit amino acid transport system substrate-binding protein